MEKMRFKKVYVEITNICNLKCSFCPDSKRKKAFMNVQNFGEIARKIKNYTNLITLHVKGEPLMHPELEQILQICDDNNLKVNITTNGTLLYDKKDILLKSISLRQLNISLHSLTQNENMSSDYLDKVFETVDELTKSNPNLYISYRLWNLQSISENDENTFILEKIEEKYNLKDIKNKAKENDFIELKTNVFLNQDTEFKWPNMLNKDISNVGTCQGLRSQIAILVNGDVVPCCLDQDGEIKLGNILEDDLEKILNTNLSQNIKTGFEEGKVFHKLCRKCEYRTRFKSY
jgi:radical SAM protein with 4Fe4S-binding SPASM domain